MTVDKLLQVILLTKPEIHSFYEDNILGATSP